VLSTGEALFDVLEVLDPLVAGGAVAVVLEPPEAVVAEGLAEWEPDVRVVARDLLWRWEENGLAGGLGAGGVT
jgi:hypothetical protein